MKCLKCNNEASIPYPNGDLCSDCYIELLVNRIKKDVRTQAPFKKDEKVLVFGKLTKIFLDKIIENLPLKIEESKSKYSKDVLNKDFKEYDKIVLPWTSDDEAEMFYSEMTSNKPDFNKMGHSKFIKLFKSVLERELITASKILNIEFEPQERNKDLEKINKKYPSAKYGLVKSSEEIKKALK